uniref:hypothetical protein n=1 Tax=Empedobacter brevis TaxID=247 RepID=UPI0039B041AE
GETNTRIIKITVNKLPSKTRLFNFFVFIYCIISVKAIVIKEKPKYISLHPPRIRIETTKTILSINLLFL